MIFHVQEKGYSLPEIVEGIAALELKFIGFRYVPVDVVKSYGARYPDDPAALNLANWAAFERDNPTTFVGMYSFGVQKPIT